MSLTELPFGMFDYHGDVYSDYNNNSIDTIVMLNNQREYLHHAGRDLKQLYLEDGYNLLHLPMPDFSIPSKETLTAVLSEAIENAKAGKNVAVHCHAGIGRAGLFLAIMAKSVLGMSGNEAVDWVRSFVTGAIQTDEQVQYVLEY